QDAERELQGDPKCARAHLLLGMIFMRKKFERQALEHLEFAVRAYKDPRIEFIYGNVLALAGHYDRAEQALQNVAKRDPSRAGAYRWLGYIYARRPDTPENRRQAERYLLTSLTLRPDYPEANVELSRFYLTQKRPQQALSCCRK